DGVVEEVRAMTGGEVKQGDVLFVLRSPRIQEMASERRSLQKDLDAVARDRASAEATYQINREIQEAEIVQRKKESEYRDRYLAVYRDVNSRIEQLGAEGLTSS